MGSQPPPDLCFVPASELLRLYKTRKASPLEVMQAVLARIDAVNPALNAYVTLARESALAGARKATAALKRKTALPPLHGIPVSIKDLTPTKGIRTTWGSKIFADHVPEEDAITVERLKQAGAIVVGKTNTPEFGAGGNTFNAVFGPTRNPWNPALTCGGSSGGAAVALATGMGPLAQGSDTGGSLRMPAAFCGVVGFRTSPGLVPHHPRALAWDTISVTGPMARTVTDTALMLSVLAGPDDRAPLSYAGRHARAHAGGEGAVGQGLAHRVDAGPRRPHPRRRRDRARRGRGDPRLSLARRTPRGRLPRLQRGQRHRAGHARRRDGRQPRPASPRWKNEMQKGLVWNIEQGLALTPEAIGRAETLRGLLWQRVRAFMETRDLLILPTTSVPPVSRRAAVPDRDQRQARSTTTSSGRS